MFSLSTSLQHGNHLLASVPFFGPAPGTIIFAGGLPPQGFIELAAIASMPIIKIEI